MVLVASISNSVFAAECKNARMSGLSEVQKLVDANDDTNCIAKLMSYVDLNQERATYYCKQNNTNAFASCAAILYQVANVVSEEAAISCLKNPTSEFSYCVEELYFRVGLTGSEGAAYCQHNDSLAFTNCASDRYKFGAKPKEAAEACKDAKNSLNLIPRLNEVLRRDANE